MQPLAMSWRSCLALALSIDSIKNRFAIGLAIKQGRTIYPSAANRAASSIVYNTDTHDVACYVQKIKPVDVFLTSSIIIVHLPFVPLGEPQHSLKN